MREKPPRQRWEYKKPATRAGGLSGRRSKAKHAPSFHKIKFIVPLFRIWCQASGSFYLVNLQIVC